MNAIKEESDLPFFPMSYNDLDKVAQKCSYFAFNPGKDRPEFQDPIFKSRRQYFADLAQNFQLGQSIPRVEYTPEEIKVWGTVFKNLTELWSKHACSKHNQVVPLLFEKCGYREDNIPQLEDISNFLKDRTGFTIRPVPGAVTARHFFAGFAFRVFHAAPFIRRASMEHFSVEPDICHEIFGHVPLLADPEFAQFVQDIGLASLGASDAEIKKLSTLFSYTVEFGLWRENGNLKIYGAGLLSSFGEMIYSMSGKAELLSLVPEKAAIRPFDPTEYMEAYYVSENFEDMREKILEYTKRIPRNFDLHYDSSSNSVNVIKRQDQIVH